MLDYYKDGKKVEISAIYDKGKVGQVVILDHVSYGDNPDLERCPLAAYHQPYAFTIAEKVEGKDGYYVFCDGEGKLIRVCDVHYGASEPYVYDANEWLAWRKGYTEDKLGRKERKIQLLEGHVALLKGILVNQGVRIVTEEGARALGLN